MFVFYLKSKPSDIPASPADNFRHLEETLRKPRSRSLSVDNVPRRGRQPCNWPTVSGCCLRTSKRCSTAGVTSSSRGTCPSARWRAGSGGAAEGDPAERAFTLDEMQTLLHYADEQVTRIRAAGCKGWLPAFRDATPRESAYGYGPRRNETQTLDVADLLSAGRRAGCTPAAGARSSGTSPNSSTTAPAASAPSWCRWPSC